jgi:hypothetical protein
MLTVAGRDVVIIDQWGAHVGARSPATTHPMNDAAVTMVKRPERGEMGPEPVNIGKMEELAEDGDTLT